MPRGVYQRREGRKLGITPTPWQVRALRKTTLVPHPDFDLPCKIWGGSTYNGYAEIRIGSRLDGSGKTVRLYKLAWTSAHGPVPAGLELDHRCRRRACWEIDHLEPVTKLENFMRGVNISAFPLRTGSCQRGHEFSGVNIYTNPRTGRRVCRICSTDNSREWRRRNK